MIGGAWHGEIPVEFLYTAGVAGERFLGELRDHGRLMGTRCASCGVIYLPPRMYCEQCFSRLTEWVEVPPRGRIFAFTVVRQDRKGKALGAPIIAAIISFEGVKGGLIHRIEGTAPGDLKPGLIVEAVIKGREARTGSILDIESFHAVAKE